MTGSHSTPAYPKLRSLEPQLVEAEGKRLIYLRDPLGLSEKTVLVPQELAPLLALCDGTRDAEGLRAGFALRTGIQISTTRIAEIIEGLDGALVFENGSYEKASAKALQAYRDAEHRQPSHADLVYPSDPEALKAKLEEYCAKSPPVDRPSATTLLGVVSPHIDYERGWATYAQLWQRCAEALDEIELAIILGTDHSGDQGTITPTRQSYATPFGVLPTDLDVVDGLANVLGHERAFAEELHHVNEHSIELAAVWFQYFLNGRTCPVVPVLCGSFHDFVTGKTVASEHDVLGSVVDYLRGVVAERRTLVIAAGDLAHVGPTFGDANSVDSAYRTSLSVKDAKSIDAVCDGDAEAFLSLSRNEQDARRICGLPPIYLALRLLDGVKGESLDYAQCPADVNSGSLVSIAGIALWQNGH